MSEIDPNVETVLSVIREVGIARLGYWDGCCCSSFSIKNVDVRISCGKSRERAVWITGRHSDYDGEQTLIPIMDEVMRQLADSCFVGVEFARHFG